MSEIWKPIKDFENIYEISNLGRIRNIQKTLRLDEVDYTIIPNSDIKPLLDKLQQENNELKKQLEESKNLKNKLLVYNTSIKHNWNTLKEYIETIYKSCPPYEKEVVMFIINKMKKLENKEDNND